MVCYDPRGMDWPQYCALMTELFSASGLTKPVDEAHWREWVDALNGIGYFVNSGIPDHRNFSTWQEWASQMVGIMSIGETA